MGVLLLAVLAASPVWEYQTPDGVLHYVGDPGEVPAAFQARARPVDLGHVSLNTQAAKELERADVPAKPETLASRLPEWPVSLAAALAFLALALLAGRGLRKAPARRTLRVAAWTASLLALASGALLALRLAAPYSKGLTAEAAKLSPSGVQAQQDRNAELLEKALNPVGEEPKRPPPRPFWSDAPPPPGLLHH